MTNRLQKILLGSCLAFGLGASAPASAEELRIGYISPVTGIFAQVGKDMVDGFKLYLDEHGNKLGGNGTGNGNFTTGEAYTYDRTAPEVIILQNPGQPDPAPRSSSLVPGRSASNCAMRSASRRVVPPLLP